MHVNVVEGRDCGHDGGLRGWSCEEQLVLLCEAQTAIQCIEGKPWRRLDAVAMSMCYSRKRQPKRFVIAKGPAAWDEQHGLGFPAPRRATIFQPSRILTIERTYPAYFSPYSISVIYIQGDCIHASSLAPLLHIPDRRVIIHHGSTLR